VIARITVRQAVRQVVQAAQGLPIDTLRTLVEKGPTLVSAAIPLPKTDDEVSPWLARVGVSAPMEPVATALVQLALPSASVSACNPDEADSELKILANSSEDGQADYLVAIAREEFGPRDGVCRSIDPATIALILQLIQTLGPAIIEWLKNRRNNTNLV